MERDCAHEGSVLAETAAATAAVVTRNCRRYCLLTMAGLLMAGRLKAAPHDGRPPRRKSYSIAFTMSSTTFLASPNTIIVRSM